MVRILRKIITGVIILILILIFAFILWTVIPFSTMPEAEAALKDNGSVKVEYSKNITFYPETTYNRGFILYPGTRVNSEAYSVMAKGIADNGYIVVLAQMPLDLSVLDIERAGEIIKSHPEVDKWALGGHSMGGAMAAFFAEDNQDLIDGIVMLGSYPSKNTDMSDNNQHFLSLYGSEDFVASEEEINSKRYLSPIDSTYFKIDGGNHAGFGYYGEQNGDGKAVITREDQHKIVIEQISSLLERL